MISDSLAMDLANWLQYNCHILDAFSYKLEGVIIYIILAIIL